MSRAKVLPKRHLRQSQENRPSAFARSKVVSELSVKNLGCLEIFQFSGYSEAVTPGYPVMVIV